MLFLLRVCSCSIALLLGGLHNGGGDALRVAELLHREQDVLPVLGDELQEALVHGGLVGLRRQRQRLAQVAPEAPQHGLILGQACVGRNG